jgi:copper ion binding protein
MQTRTLQLTIEGMSCEHCAATVEKVLSRMEGIGSAVVNLEEHRATVQYDAAVTGPQAMIDAIAEAGYNSAVAA